jgi:hypothetical protein
VTYATTDSNLPDQSNGDEADTIRQAVWFCCRGIGVTDTAIATHLNPQALALLADRAARDAVRA